MKIEKIKKNKLINFLVTSEELAIIEKVCAKYGLKKSEWIRFSAMNFKPTAKDVSSLKQSGLHIVKG